MNCGPLSEMIRGRASGNFSRARWSYPVQGDMGHLPHDVSHHSTEQP
jgi:hypothetical protein